MDVAENAFLCFWKVSYVWRVDLRKYVKRTGKSQDYLVKYVNKQKFKEKKGRGGRKRKKGEKRK
jgi:hypothetical protein